MLRLLGTVAIFCGIGFGLICAAFRSMNAPQRSVAYTGAAVLILFALGGAAWDIFGLWGCGYHTTAGLTWYWPW